MKRVYEGVKEILDIVQEVYIERNRVCPIDLIVAAKLFVELRDASKSIYVDEKVRKRFIRGLVIWAIFEQGYSFKRLYDRVLDYLSVFEVDEFKERYIKEFIIAYTEYVAKRWGVRVNCGATDEKMVLAAKVARALCKEYKITMYQYMLMQHECWEKIQQPLSMVALSDERRCRRRHEVYIDVQRKRGTIRREDYSNGAVGRKWHEVVNMGVDKFLARVSAKGYLAYVARLYKQDMESGLNQNELQQRYSPERVEEKWKELEGAVGL